MPKAAKIRLEGCNGEWFTLSGHGRADKQVDLSTDPSGIFDAPVKTIYNSHAFQVGATYGGKRYLHRDVVFGINVFGESKTRGKMSWEQADSQWRKAWSYDEDCKLWAIGDTNDARYLKLRLAEEPMLEPRKDPRLTDYGLVTMTTIAADPWWYSAGAEDSWTSTLSSTGGQIRSGTVTVSNPTDVPLWLQWVVQGGAGVKWSLPDFSFGSDAFERASQDANKIIPMPALLADEHIHVDTNPDALNGQVNSTLDTQVYMRMQGRQFLYPVPPYTPPTELPVRVTNAPAGVGVQVRMSRAWSRPWGLH